MTLIELVVGVGLAALLSLALIAAVGTAVRFAASADADATGVTQTRALFERLRAQAHSAWAIFVPRLDVLGVENSDGHEIDFFAEDAQHAPHFWAYRFDARAHTLERYLYAAPGTPGLPSGDLLSNVDAFSATSFAASSVPDPLFSGASVQNVRVDFGLGSDVIGGNALVRVSVKLGIVLRECILASATAPTGFTLVYSYTPAP